MNRVWYASYIEVNIPVELWFINFVCTPIWTTSLIIYKCVLLYNCNKWLEWFPHAQNSNRLTFTRPHVMVARGIGSSLGVQRGHIVPINVKGNFDHIWHICIIKRNSRHNCEDFHLSQDQFIIRPN